MEMRDSTTHKPFEPTEIKSREIPLDDIIITKEALLPKVGDDLPIPQELVGCTQALFFEYRHQTTVGTLAPYCLKPHDHEYQGRIYRSMYLDYISCDSEYEAAIKILGNYAHWLKLKATSWFAPYLEAWNEELTLREEALARSKLVQLTQQGNVTAARTLLGNKVKPVGRAKKAARKDDIHLDDLECMLDRTEPNQVKH